MNQLYYGDNLQVLREHLADESVDLIYLAPSFNSKRDYNLLFKSPVAANVGSLQKKSGQSGLTFAATDYSEAQIEAFEDIALFISLDDCTKGMIKDAASAGFYESPNKKKYPRVQLLTIEGLLSKKQRAEHPDYEPDLNFKKAKTESNAAQKELI
jgi:hypothetical protein